jgi:hypothetical protein
MFAHRITARCHVSVMKHERLSATTKAGSDHACLRKIDAAKFAREATHQQLHHLRLLLPEVLADAQVYSIGICVVNLLVADALRATLPHRL